LNELCTCREEIAEQLDRPVFKVISDDLLLSMAHTMPDSAEGLEEAGLTKLQIERFGSKLLKVIHSGCNAPPVARTRSKRLNDTTLARLEKLKEWRKKEAAGMQVESDIILPKPMLYSIAEQGPRDMEKLNNLMSESPWRYRHFGESILKALEAKAKSKPTPAKT
jgi:ribonuclease D